MGHCYHHALSSVRKWGGVAEDYLPLHQWFDESKAITADFRHRALRHHAEGIFMLERFFGRDHHHLDGPRRSGAAYRRAACGRGSRLHPELRRLGALHSPPAVDGSRAADPQAGRSLRRDPNANAADDPSTPPLAPLPSGNHLRSVHLSPALPGFRMSGDRHDHVHRRIHLPHSDLSPAQLPCRQRWPKPAASPSKTMTGRGRRRTTNPPARPM